MWKGVRLRACSTGGAMSWDAGAKGSAMQLLSIASMLPVPRAVLRRRLGDALRRASAFGATCLDCCRQGYAAAARYKELARLSPAELRRRGIQDGDLLSAIGDQLGKRSIR
jgi:hypothetical protein